MKYVFPAVFYYDDDKVSVKVPDIPGCYSYGDDMADAIEMAEDAICMMITSFEDDGTEIPFPSSYEDIQKNVVEDNVIISYVVADTVKWRKENNNKAVKKTLSIPSWLNTKAENANINFSQVLQEALIQKLEI